MVSNTESKEFKVSENHKNSSNSVHHTKIKLDENDKVFKNLPTEHENMKWAMT